MDEQPIGFRPSSTPTPAPKVLMAEVASVRSDFYENVDRLFKVWTRHDEVEEANISKAGRYYQYPFGLYERTMERDAHLRSLFNLRVAALLARPWEITPAIDDDGKALEVCEFVREVFDAIGTDDGEEGFEQDRKELQSALPYGFAVFEILWEVREGRYYVRKLMHRHNRRFLFDLETSAPRLVTETAQLEGVALPPYKFIVATFDPSWENPYGFPLCRPSFFNSYLKNEAMKLFAFAIERQACDISVATYDETAETNLKQQASRLVRSLQRGVGVAKPSSIELEVHALNKTGTAEAMRTFIDECDEANTKLWLGGTLNVDQGDTGSYSLGKVHADHFRQLIESDAKWHAAIWTNQLIRWIVELNFGEQAAAEFCPRMVISLDDEPDTMNLMEIAERAVKMGVRIPTAWFHETFGIPVAEEGEEVIEKQEVVLPFPPAPQRAQVIPPSMPPPNPQTAKRKQPPPAKLAETGDIERPHESAPRLVKVENAAVLHGDAVYSDLVKQVHDWLDDQSSLSGALANEEDAIRDNTAFLTYLRRVWLAASVGGYRDLLKDLKRRSPQFARKYEKRHKPLRELTTMLAEAEIDFLVEGDKPIPVEALRNMEKRTAVDRPTFDAMDARAKANALTAANLSIETIDGKLRLALQNAIAEGMTLAQFKKQMADEPFMSDWHREVVYRTNVQSAYNAGRWELGQDPDVASYFPAAQIAAVMDERTSDICRELNGQLVSRAQLDSGEMVPPFHYACRTVLVYLTADDLQNELRNGNGWARPDTSPMLEGFGYVDIPKTEGIAPATSIAPEPRRFPTGQLGDEEANKWAAEHFEKWNKSLTAQEREAVNTYSMAGYRDIQPGLYDAARRGANWADIEKDIRLIDKAVAKGSLPETVVTARGADVRILPKGFAKDPQAFVGKSFSSSAFTSTTMVEDHMDDFLRYLIDDKQNPVICEIVIPKNTPVASIYAASEGRAFEAELLLGRDTSFRITGVTSVRRYGQNIPKVFCEVIPNA